MRIKFLPMLFEPVSIESMKFFAKFIESNYHAVVTVRPVEKGKLDLFLREDGGTDRTDIVVLSNRCRKDFAEFPSDVRLITWVQDRVWNLNITQEQWNQCPIDRMFGYTDWLSFQDRTVFSRMLTDTSIYYPKLSNNKNTMSTVFIGGRGYDQKDYFKKIYVEHLKHKVKESTWKALCFKLRLLSEEDSLPSSMEQMSEILHSNEELVNQMDTMTPEERNKFIYTIAFWWVNDTIYRQRYLNLIKQIWKHSFVYGKGWQTNRMFLANSKGSIPYDACSDIYKTAEYGIHLNVMEGFHQRPWQILCSGAKLLTRYNGNRYPVQEFNFKHFREWQCSWMEYLADTLFFDKSTSRIADYPHYSNFAYNFTKEEHLHEIRDHN